MIDNFTKRATVISVTLRYSKEMADSMNGFDSDDEDGRMKSYLMDWTDRYKATLLAIPGVTRKEKKELSKKLECRRSEFLSTYDK